ncbi:MAG: hypothetical protein L0220_31980, partial [Acidobacteria bacterium]|nr:hypothetical protein [Acidobacteriota bacterium]
DVKVYLNCFSGELRRKLERTVTEMGEIQFKQYLKKVNEEITGIAVSDLEQSDQQTATLRVEFVFHGKTEAQKHHFKLIDGTWRIDSMENGERVKTLIPYGREVEDKE